MPISWDSTDLDGAASEVGVVHESTADADYDDASVLRQGYSAASPPFASSLQHYYLLQEDSGSTAHDFAGSNDGTVTGPTQGTTGLLGTTAYSFDGTDDYIDITAVGHLSAYTIWAWVYPTATGDGDLDQIMSLQNNQRLNFRENGGSWEVVQRDSGGGNNSVSTPATQDAWELVTATWDGSTLAIYTGATQGDSTSLSSSSSGASADDWIGGKTGQDEWFTGRIGPVGIHTAALSQSEIQTLRDIVTGTAELITQSKTA
jgi:hypothetical protein